MIRRIMLLFYELHYKFPRFKLWRICRVLKIKPYNWQRAFALGKTESLQYPPGRATGKTMAVMLRLLMGNPNNSIGNEPEIMANDPDYCTADRHMLYWYGLEYRRLSILCYNASIPVRMDLNLIDLHPAHYRHKPH